VPGDYDDFPFANQRIDGILDESFIPFYMKYRCLTRWLLLVWVGVVSALCTLAEKLPSAREVLDRSIKEMGGREAFLKLSSQVAKGRFEMPAQGLTGTIELSAAKPSKLLLSIELGALGKILSGYDGESAWIINPGMGPMLMEGKMREQMVAQADFFATLHDSALFSSMTTLGKTNFDGQDCFEVKLVRKNGDELREFYTVKTGLARGVIAKVESPLGTVQTTTFVTDYKKFGEILFATRVSQKMSGMEQVMTFQTVEFNQVPEARFELPKEVKTLVEQKKAIKK
jgi:hypothetical protein